MQTRRQRNTFQLWSDSEQTRLGAASIPYLEEVFASYRRRYRSFEPFPYLTRRLIQVALLHTNAVVFLPPFFPLSNS